MSAIRLGKHPDGSRDIRIVDDGAVARVHGRNAFSGSMVATVIPRRVPYALDRPICGATMKHQQICARNPGHAPGHKTEASLRAEAAQRGKR
jgi:hypothetical protein